MGSAHLSPYEDPDAHARVSALIRSHSSNGRDVRDELLATLDLADARDVLDLGCGFGFWAGALARRVAPDAVFTGVDACAANEASYVAAVGAAGRRARFLHAELAARLHFPDAAFDLVVAAYSLYFFPGVVADAARVLRPGGLFLAVTHSEESLAGLLAAVGLDRGDAPLLRRMRAFSSESGGDVLAGSFSEVERTHYWNTLTFEEDGLGDLLEYLRFKLPVVCPGAHYEAELPEALARSAEAALRRDRRLVVEKDDTLFVCRGPHGR